MAFEITPDEARTRSLAAKGDRAIRFWSDDVMVNPDGVIAEIKRALAAFPSPSPPREREGNGKP